jgi:uncharacterized FlaG/YvyC family protein
MNIKGLVSNVIPFPVKKNDEAKAKSALDTDNEKDGNGQSSTGGDQRRRNLTPEEIIEAVKHLENLQGVKDNGLKVRQETNDGITVVYVEDRDGKVVRRIPESELSLLTGGNRERKSGQLLNKAL